MTKEKIMKMMNIAKKYGKKIAVMHAAPLAVLAVLPMTANAALTEGVKNAITGGFADAQEGAGLMIVGFAAIFGIMLIKRLFTR